MSVGALKACRLRIYGTVQGVWFRAWTEREARALDLSGWVRNRRDGSVEILAVGAPAMVEALIERCHGGPPAAAVTRVEVTPATGITPDGFTVKPTV